MFQSWHRQVTPSLLRFRDGKSERTKRTNEAAEPARGCRADNQRRQRCSEAGSHVGVRAFEGGLRVPDDEYIWPRAERIAGKALHDIFGERIEEQCRLGLQHAHEIALAQATSCIEAKADLEAHGVDSWIAGAVLHALAFETAWDVFGTNPEFGVESIPCDDGQGEEEEDGGGSSRPEMSSERASL